MTTLPHKSFIITNHNQMTKELNTLPYHNFQTIKYKMINKVNNN